MIRPFFQQALSLGCAALLLGAAPATRPVSDTLRAIAHEMTYDWGRAHPPIATGLGLSDEDARLDTPSKLRNEADLATIRSWNIRLAATPLQGASLHDRDDTMLLRAQLIGMERSLTTYRAYAKNYAGPTNAIVTVLLNRGTTGFYFITPPKSLADAATRLDPNEDSDRDRILSTGAHEAMPGHFLQLSIARRNPDLVRKIQTSGVFAEGWAFYGEGIFVNLGLFGERLDGRYYVAQWERVRGARATVDAELASGAWSYDRAVVFFAREAGFPVDAAQAQVAAIALNPGSLISYTVGRYQLEALLASYRERLGSHASLIDFHDRLLSYGTTPFAVVGPELLADLDKPVSAVMAAANY